VLSAVEFVNFDFCNNNKILHRKQIYVHYYMTLIAGWIEAKRTDVATIGMEE